MTTLIEIEPEYRGALEAAKLADFGAMLRAPAAGPPASKHAHRETVPLEIVVDGAPRRFFLKRVFKVPPRHAIWPLFRLRRGISQPRHEWNMLGQLAECGIPAAKRVAYGERRIGGVPMQAFLLVEAAAFEHTLEDWLVDGFERPAAINAAERESLILETGRLVGLLEAHGFSWPDLHAKHILARPYGSTSWDLCTIDLERAKRKDAKSEHRLSFRHLRYLHRSMLPTRWTPKDLHAFADGYLGSLNGAFDDVELRRVREIITNYAMSYATPRQPDGLRHDRTIDREVVNGIVAAREDHAILTAAGIRGLDDVFALSGGDHLTKPGLAAYRDRIRLTLRGADNTEQACYLKRYRRPPLMEQLRRMREHDRRDSSAKREAHFIKRLSLLGIPTMRCLAWGQEMSGPWERRSFIITEEISGESLEKLAARAAVDPSVAPSPRDRQEIIRQLALIARQMHGHRMYHRDLYLSHVFLTRNADGGIVLRLIDLARMIEKPLLRDRWMVKDLAALEYSNPAPLVTRADRLRFLYHYQFGARVSPPKGWIRELIGRVRRRTKKMARHDAKKVSSG